MEGPESFSDEEFQQNQSNSPYSLTRHRTQAQSFTERQNQKINDSPFHNQSKSYKSPASHQDLQEKLNLYLNQQLMKRGIESPQSSSYQSSFSQGISDSRNEPELIQSDSFSLLATGRTFINHKSVQGNVFERLYLQKKRPSRSIATRDSEESVQRVQRKSNVNYGAMLYFKGTKMKEQVQRKNKLIKAELESNEIAQLPFKPQLGSSQSQCISRSFTPVEERLMQMGTQKQLKLHSMREKQRGTELRDCTFTPLINNNQQVSKDSTVPKYQELYKDAKLREQRLSSLQEEASSQFSFKPSITHSRSQKLEETNFMRRIENFQEEFNQKMQKLKEQLNPGIDPTTGKPFFQPQLISPVQRKREGNVFDHLYLEKDKVAERKEALQSQYEQSRQQEKNHKSDKIYNDFRIKQYEKLFDQLDHDSDGFISADSISIEHVELKILEILLPLFEYMEQDKITISKSEFVELVVQISQNLTIEEKAYLTRREKIIKVENPCFRPKILGKSSLIAQIKRKEGEDIYERNLKEKQISAQRIKALSENLSNEEKKECTFTPKILGFKHLRKGR